MPLNIIIDFVMLIAMALVSISGVILEIVIPSRHAVRLYGCNEKGTADTVPYCVFLL